MRILRQSNPKELRRLMQELKVDPYGIKIMLPKASACLVRINSVSSIAANILKQEMLSFGGDVAVARDTLTGRARSTDCLIMGNLAQFGRLAEKLNRQPFGLAKLGRDLSDGIANYQRQEFAINLGRHRLALKEGKTCIMGIVNLTPDSFSGDGLYMPGADKIIEHAQRMADDGADIIDIGGESTRPGASPVALREELKRTIPAIKKLARKIKAPISIDTYKPEVARQALDNGATLVNDISGLSGRMAKVASKYGAGVVIMHMKGAPRTMQDKPVYKNLIDEITQCLDKAIKRAVEAGVDRKKIIIDPGIGFGKALGHNLEILNRLREFKILGRPILVGPSRKSFIGRILDAGPQERLFGTLSASVMAAQNGANIIRAHDVRALKEALRVTDAILRA